MSEKQSKFRDFMDLLYILTYLPDRNCAR